MKYLYGHYLSIITYQITTTDFLGPLIVVLILTYILYISLSFIYKDRINKKGIIILYLLYFVCLVYLLLFKNFGIRGITFNPFDMIKDIISGNTFVPLMNVLMFIPLGILSKGNKKVLPFYFIGILFIEILQYTFSLGIFDIADIISNYVGTIIGYSISESKFFNLIINKIK
ncbi:VanZ family protein [Streptococcus orisratti]|jgi:glycopeptide antibiotics resistance protein